MKKFSLLLFFNLYGRGAICTKVHGNKGFREK